MIGDNNPTVSLYLGDCLDVMPVLDPVDAIVCDPPYGLGFMGRAWDAPENVAFRSETWRLAFDRLKPGGHLVAFGGTRTYHRLACAIEDAGFEIRDQLGWVYGTGFPKSHDVSKGIDAKLGAERDRVAPRSVIGHQRNIGNRRPYMDDPNHTTVSDNPASDEARQWQGWGTALKPAWEPIVLARKPLIGTVAENVLRWGVGALNIDGCRVGDDVTVTVRNGNSGGNGAYGRDERVFRRENPPGRWPANIVHDGSDEVLAAFPKRHVNTPGSRGKSEFWGTGAQDTIQSYEKDGSAARFFYCAKASKTERGIGNDHPTVKPSSLLRWLTRLVCPPSGLILDPFMGSGTTGVACVREGFRFTGIEQEAPFYAIAERRIREAKFGAAPVEMLEAAE